MELNLRQIKDASQCYRYYRYLEKGVRAPQSSLLTQAESVIKRAYLRGAQTDFRASWKTIVGWVDTAIFKELDVTDEEQFKIGRSQSEIILLFLSKWYNEVYMKEDVVGFPDVPLKSEIDWFCCLIKDTAPIIKTTDPPTIITFSDIVRSEFRLYNDISIRGLAWLASEALGCGKVAVDEIAMGERGAMTVTSTTLDRLAHERARKMIKDVVNMIVAGVNYPSVTEKCSTCPFLRRCSI